MGAILEAIKDGGLGIRDISTRDTDLEDIFVTLTAKSPETSHPRMPNDPLAGSIERIRSQPHP